MPFPDFNPVALQLGPIAIRWYALAYVAGILLGWRYAVAMLKNARLWTLRPPPLTPAQMDDLVLWVTLGIIVGGRLGHVIFYTPQIIWTDPIEILKVWNGGMSFHGGGLGVLIALVVFAWRNKQDALRLGDVAAAAAPIGLFFGRLANFVNGELWGRPTDLPWGIVFCNKHILQTYGDCPMGARHPSQLYEAALEGIVLFLLLRWATHGRHWTNRRGAVMGLFIAGYGLARVALENVRQPDRGLEHLPLGLTMGMYLSIPMILVGLWLVWRGLREPPPQEAHEPA